MPLQSVLFKKSSYTKAEARNWLRNHGYKSNIDPDRSTKLYWHSRQSPPQRSPGGNRRFLPKAHGRYYSKKITKTIIFRFDE